MTFNHSTLHKNVYSISSSNTITCKLVTAFSAVALSTPVLATNNVSPNDDITTLPTITVTATRTPTAINNTIAQTRVIDSEDLKRYQGQTVLDVLKNQPGFNFKQNGSMGTTSNFYLRGYDSTQVLVLVDGVRFSSISTGQPSLNLLPTDQIERIEILYGASGSSIYGADAMGGVIQIFTKGNNIEHSELSITTGIGSNDQYLYGTTAQFKAKQGTSLSLSANHNVTDGINATYATHPWGIHNKDEDGFESNNYSIFLNHQLNNDIKVGLSGIYSNSTSEYDSGPTTESDFTKAEQKTGSAQAFLDWHYSPNSSVKLSYGQSIDETKDTATSYTSNYDTKQQQVSLVGNHSLPVGNLLYGAEHLKQNISSSAYSDIDDRKVTSGFLGYVVSKSNFDAQANIRYDDYSNFDSETTYNVGAAYRISPEFRTGANYAKGYRVPTFNDLYNYGGDPNLKPEKSDNYEVFIEYATDNQVSRITGYRNDVDDMIASDANYQRKNYAKAKIEGVTLTSDWFIDNYLFGLNYDYQQAKDNSGLDNDGNNLAFRPEHKGTIYLGYQLSDFNIRAEYQYNHDYFSDIENTSKVDSFSLVNINGNYQLSPNLSISTRINNLFNKKYITVPHYKTDGTNFFTSLTYTWK